MAAALEDGKLLSRVLRASRQIGCEWRLIGRIEANKEHSAKRTHGFRWWRCGWLRRRVARAGPRSAIWSRVSKAVLVPSAG